MKNENTLFPTQELHPVYDPDVKNTRSKNHHLYMNAVQEFYETNYYQSQRILLSARPYFSDLDPASSWIAIDNLMLSILICLIQKDFQLLQSEIAKLKRMLKKNYVSDEAQKELKSIYKLSKVYFNNKKAEPVIEWFYKIQKEQKILRNVEINALLFS
jgi:hypothetical protein